MNKPDIIQSRRGKQVFFNAAKTDGFLDIYPEIIKNCIY